MKNVVYIDNRDSFADTIAAHFELAGAKVRMYKSNCSLDTIAQAQPDIILLGPGPNSPAEAGNYLQAINRFHAQYPIFGICLGFQALMHYFGEKVVPLEEAVHGAFSQIQHTGTSFFEGIKSPAEFARYHSLGVYGVPESFNPLAQFPDSNGRNIIMAAQHKQLPLAGIQFHPESILSTNNGQGTKLIENVLKYLTK